MDAKSKSTCSSTEEEEEEEKKNKQASYGIEGRHNNAFIGVESNRGIIIHK